MLVLWYGRRGKRGLIVLVGGEALLLLWVLLLLLLMLLLLELGGLGSLTFLMRGAAESWCRGMSGESARAMPMSVGAQRCDPE